MDEPKQSTSARVRRMFPALLALIPLGLALGSTSRIPQGRSLSTQKVLPPLAFRQYSVNLREFAPTAVLTAPFSFWNRSHDSLEITRLEPSCGCLAPKLLGNRKEYGPGAQGLFEVQIETAREAPGPHTYTIDVHYRVNQVACTERVTFQCDIPERNVTVTPPELYFYQLGDAPLSSEILVEDHRGKHLRVVEAVTSSPHLALSVGEQKRTDDSKSATPVQIAVQGEVPPGAHTSFVTLRTDDADFPVIRVPVFLQGKQSSVRLTSGTTPGEEAPKRTRP